MRRGCLFTVLGILGICVIACGLGYFVAIPRIRDREADQVRDSISTQVAIQIPAGDTGEVPPGTYTLTAAELQEGLLANVDDDTVDDLSIRITPAGLELALKTSGDQEATYTGLPVASDGELEMTDMDSTSGMLNFIFPAENLGDAIEDGVNDYLRANNLTLDSLTLNNGSITLETVPAS